MSSTMNVILPQSTARQIGLEGVAPSSMDGFPVLYLLHGLSDDHTIWMRRTSIERYVAALGLAVVMPTTHRGFYVNMSEGAQYLDFFRDELPEICQSFFKLSARRENTFIAGLSMGGFGAFRLALETPERFRAAASLSGALDIATHTEASSYRRQNQAELKRVFGRDIEQLKGTDADLIGLFQKHKASGAAFPDLYACCGTEDFLLQENRHFRDAMDNEGIALTYEEGPGLHDWAFWDQWIQRVLEWLPLERPRS